MRLFIRVENGEPQDHPALEHNLIETFGEVPSNWELFERVDKPRGPYIKVLSETPTYEKINGVWKDVWNAREFTPEEKAAKIQGVYDYWNSLSDPVGGWPSWVFNEELCVFMPPNPVPNEPGNYKWDEASLSFVPA